MNNNDSKPNEVNSLILNGNLCFVAQEQVEILEAFFFQHVLIDHHCFSVFYIENGCWNYK